MDYKTNDNETIYLIKENSEDAKDLLVSKYKYIIDIVINKYKRMAYLLKVDYNDLYQEAMLGFADALDKYKDDKEASLPTFITLCVERKLQNVIKRASALKNKMMNETLSLEGTSDNETDPLINVISDNNENNPLNNLTEEENYLELKNKISEILSENEFEVFEYMIMGLSYIDIAELTNKVPKQIDNTIQRIRIKTKKLLDNNK